MEWGIKKNTEVKKGNGEVGDFLRGRGDFEGNVNFEGNLCRE